MNTTEKFSLPHLLTAMVAGIYCVGLIWWCWLRYFDVVGQAANYLFNIPMALSPLIVGSVLIISSLRKSRSISLKRYPLYFGGYLFFWSLGVFMTLIYNIIFDLPIVQFLGGDFAYVGSQIGLIVAVVGFAYKAKHWSRIKNILQKVMFFGTAPLIQLFLYWVVMHILGEDPFPRVDDEYVLSTVTLILNLVVFFLLYVLAFMLFFYPIEKVYVSIAILFIIGITIQYITDYYFILLLAKNTFYIGHGVDMMFMSVYVFMSFTGLQIYKKNVYKSISSI